MKKRIYALLLLFFAFTLTFTTTFAQSNNESVLIHPLLFPDGSTITISSDQEIILGFGWGACTPGLVRAYIHAAHLDWSLNGQLIFPSDEASQYWVLIGPIDPSTGGTCIAGNGTLWGARWRYSMGNLGPGIHQIHFHHWVSHRIIDGWDSDGDGKMEVYNGTLDDWSVTVNVVDP
jgi:hypothetical protein